MAPRKRQTYRPRRRRPPDRGPQQYQAEQALDSAARRLVAMYDAAELHALVEQSREACQWADQQAQDQPSPEALRRYRAAQQALAEAERALALAGQDAAGSP